ncbi:Peroxisomal biogenesis factor 2 [Candida viswanathii]|uniref:Peroxisomal biogenesis factor 2 n=1 Tax=Candida viswanathii TaxID=5486 RepID=A0A367XPQ5_9ASCO|nr:Peroxisomal biogenesis factor 2 [Candida viswanathii]
MIPISYPSPRVSQLDAGILDSELFTLLKEQLSSVFQLHPDSRFSFIQHQELYSLALNLLIFKLTVWKSGSSYGSLLQNLKLSDSRTGKVISNSKRYLLGVLLIGGYLYKRLETYLYSLDDSETTTSDSFLGKIKNYFVINRLDILSRIDNLVKIANLVNFTIFLVNGRYSSVIYRLLGITETPITSDISKFDGSNVNYEFQNRQLVWNVMTEFLVFILPLLQLRKLRKMAGKLFGKPGNSLEVQSGNGGPFITAYTSLPVSECAICHDNNNQAAASGGRTFPSAGPVTNPYITNCGHVYCYVCIATRFNMIKMNNEDLPCLRCGQRLEWFEEFGADERAIDEGAITIQPEIDESDEEEEEEAKAENEEDETGSISSEKDVEPYEPEHKGTQIQRHLSQRSHIFDEESADEFSEDEYSEEEDFDADELM